MIIITKIIIDGNKFNNLEEFYQEIEKLFTKDIEFKIGHNLDAFNDLLSGGFGVNLKKPIIIKWLSYHKSKKDLGDKIILKIIEIILNNNIKLEL